MVRKQNDWTEDTSRGTKCEASKCFAKPRLLALGNTCVKYFKIKYSLTEKVPRPVHEERPFQEIRRARNRTRSERRRKKKEHERREEAEAIEWRRTQERGRALAERVTEELAQNSRKE